MRAVLWIVAAAATLAAAERVLKIIEMAGEPFGGIAFGIAGPAAGGYAMLAVVAATAATILGRMPRSVEAHAAPETRPATPVTPAPASQARVCAACSAPVESWHGSCSYCGSGMVRFIAS